MKSNAKSVHPSRRFSATLARALVVAGFLLGVNAFAFIPSSFFGTNANPNYVQLESWSFYDSTNWTDDDGYAPISFTNLNSSNLGNGHSLVVGTNLPAWLQYNVVENDGTTNLTLGQGTATFWFAPSWSGTNMGGTGPGEFGRLLEVGGYTPDSSFGWWSIYVDDVGCNLYFSAQTNDLSSSVTTYLTAPISWTTNYFHFVALTYSATNTALYLDGTLVTNGPGVTVYPGSDVLANGFFIGGDSNGVYQANGFFNNVTTYSTPLDAYTIQQLFGYRYWNYLIDPLNVTMMRISSAPSVPAYTPTYNVITGAGNLQWMTNTTVVTSSGVWLTNITSKTMGGGTVNVTFTIMGGTALAPYDVFANSMVGLGPNSAAWAWMGQGYTGNTYALTNLPSDTGFLILGTPQDTSGYGLTDAYEQLVLKIDPNGSQIDSYGVPYAWYAENGITPAGAATQDPDQDGLLNYQEYQYGTKPNVSEGLAIWTAANGTTVIP